MDLSNWIWLATAAYCVLAFEEFELDRRNWAREAIRLPVDFFHIAPYFWAGRHFSPGLIAAVLFLPIATACYLAANALVLLDLTSLARSFVHAALLMAMSIVLLHVKSRPYFPQDRP